MKSSSEEQMKVAHSYGQICRAVIICSWE